MNAPSTDAPRHSTGPRIVAVTVTYNSSAVLPDFLDSVLRQQGDWRLLIVDNLSTDGTREMLAGIDDPRIEVLLNTHNSGFAAGSNIGIRHALEMGAERILLINNDTSFDDDVWTYLDGRLTALNGDAISPVITTDPDHDAMPTRIWYAGGRLSWTRGIRNHHDHYGQPVERSPQGEFTTEFCPACCMMFDRSVFERIGLLSERYFVYVEDTDYSWRMKLAHMRTFVTPHRTIRHKESVLTGGDASSFTVREKAKGRVIFMRRFGSTAGLARTVVLLTASAMVSAVRTPHGSGLAKAKWQGVRQGLAQPLTADERWSTADTVQEKVARG